MATHKKVPQSGSRHAAFRIRAASCGEGDWGFGFAAAGGSVCVVGLTLTHRRRTARRQAPDRILSAIMKFPRLEGLAIT